MLEVNNKPLIVRACIHIVACMRYFLHNSFSLDMDTRVPISKNEFMSR